MLYENKETGEYGITHDMLVSRLPHVSFPYGIQEIDKYKSYERVDKPTATDAQEVTEGKPLEGKQVWVVTEKEVTEEKLRALRETVKAKITDKRWAVESGGISFPNQVTVKTAKDDQDRMLSVIINAERNGIEEIDFKADSGWIKVSIFALKQLAKEITYFVQHCFKTEKYHHGYIDSLTNPAEICSYDYSTGWAYSSTDESTKVLNIYDLNIVDVMTLLYSNFIFSKMENNSLLVTEDKYIDAQALIDKTYYGVPDLIPAQFYYLLAKSKLDDAIQELLPPLRVEDISKYSKYKSYLYGARVYEFSKAFEMYTDIKAKVLAVDSSLDFTVSALKTLWLEASQIK